MFRSTLCFCFLALCLFVTTSHTQSITGNLKGRVVDENGNAVPQVNISVRGDNIQGIRGSVTDESGNFRVLAIPVGSVAVKLSHIGFHELRYENVIIKLGKTTPLGEIQFTPKTLQLPDVVVERSKPVIDLNSTTAGANISVQNFEELPTGRDFLSITTLLPRANASFLGDDVNIGGATGQENAYYIDGMNTTDPYKAIGSTELPYNFVKELEVKSGGYEAEFGRATGGIVNVITYSGGNELHGKAFGFYTADRLANESRLGFVDLSTGDFTRYDTGFSLGGRILKDKLWFFLAYNNKVEKEDVTFEGLGVRSDKTVANIFAGKLTWQPTEKSNIMFSVFGDPSKRDRIGHNGLISNPNTISNPDPFLGKWQDGGINFSLKASHILNTNWLFEAALSRYDADFIAEAATARGKTEPLFEDLTTGIWSGGYGQEWDRRNVRNAASFTGTYFLKEHSLKAGFQFEDNTFEEDWRWQSSTGPHNAGLIWKFSDTSYVALPLDFQSRVRNRVASPFVQGSFQLHSKLRINTGFRWDSQSFKGLDSDLGQNITGQFQPRFGFIFQPAENETQKISGSFGRFYEQVPNLMVALRYGGLFQEAFRYDHNPLEDSTGGIRRVIRKPEDNGILEPDLKGEHFDEFTLGYERQVHSHLKVGIRGVYRATREIIQNSDDPVTGELQRISGNPGRGILSFLPKPKREHKALELTLEKFRGERFNFLTSYVLSRNYGNYTGLFYADGDFDFPNAGPQYDQAGQLENGTGLLPNDRTHVFKFHGSYRFGFGLLAGTSFVWQRGTPISEFGGAPPSNQLAYTFLGQRGANGRTPTIWDLNFRLTYNLNRLFKTSSHQKIILDVFHLFSQRKAVRIDQQHFFSLNPETGEQIGENPNYLSPLLFQPPMSIRFGLEFGF